MEGQRGDRSRRCATPFGFDLGGKPPVAQDDTQGGIKGQRGDAGKPRTLWQRGLRELLGLPPPARAEALTG